jgi:hypothetical protein
LNIGNPRKPESHTFGANGRFHSARRREFALIFCLPIGASHAATIGSTAGCQGDARCMTRPEFWRRAPICPTLTAGLLVKRFGALARNLHSSFHSKYVRPAQQHALKPQQRMPRNRKTF